MKKRYNQREQALYYTLSKSRGKQLNRIIDNIGYDVTKIICDTCGGILNGDISIKSDTKAKLGEYKQILRKLGDNSIDLKRRRNILNQKGSGFLPILLPIITSLLGSILNK